MLKRNTVRCFRCFLDSCVYFYFPFSERQNFPGSLPNEYQPSFAFSAPNSGFGGFSGFISSASASSQTFNQGMPGFEAQPQFGSFENHPSSSAAEKPKVIEIRKTFPETWLFDSFDFNST